ncbi:DUF481 domain-containing protein [Opitutus sp. GAS368]|jgi:hypothetical protein|uniref:DUF481 domain-containing protein n=1 Tax=Opitutus sp. GAS368 TaxID=1882749 RepID=UPI00087D974E|nr:DUF481 domain-containing protein [Opitutus sp. GAS368]SDR80517.1 Protein of unknown function, DUF481 [Opitutus sp. GAS368]
MSRTLLGNFIVWFVLGLAVAGRAAESEASARDVLVYKDGDRVQGRLLRQEGDILVFQSDRFGVLQVPVDRAVVIKAETPVASVAATPPVAAVPPVVPEPQEKKAAERAEAERVSRWEMFSPAVLTARLRNYFGPWHGRLAFSTEVVSDTADRSTLSLEGRLGRKWTANEVQLNGRFDYSETNKLTTTDIVKGDGLWRHDFTKNSFIQYRPTLEWNRANFKLGVPADYVLLQQEIGTGISLLATPARKLRVGVSENLFDVWNTSPPASHSSRTSESAFVETELRLPWGMLLTERGVYYYSFSSRNDGWENRLELTKKFTETFSTAIRHEIRRGSPDGTAQDYTRLKLLLGLDF